MGGYPDTEPAAVLETPGDAERRLYIAAVPIRVRLPGFTSFVVSGPEAVQAFFKNTQDLSTTSWSISIMQNAFGCPPHLLGHSRPRPPVDGAPDAVEQAIRRGVQTGRAGPQLDVLADRFQAVLLEKLRTPQGSSIGEE